LSSRQKESEPQTPLGYGRLMARGALTLAASVAVLAAVGCGGGDQLSQAEFREQGNAICTRYDKQIDELPVPSAIDQIPAYVAKAAPIVENEIDELKPLDPPDEDQETFDQMISEEEKTLAAGRALSDAAEKGDDAAVEEALNEGNIASTRADQHAKTLGLTECVDAAE
jgi:hypothetical protein